MEDRPQQPSWERRILETILRDGLIEQRRRRRWGIFFKALGLVYLTVMLALALSLKGGDGLDGKPHTALVSLTGIIRAKGDASAENVISALDAAFADKGTIGVVLRVNSPGGSPVQAGMIYDEIRRLRAKYPNIPLYAVVEDLCASGGYYAAVAADKIFVDKASMVGSIGVIINGFGFTGAMEKLGIDRRLIVTGKNKAFLDPFSPPNPEHRAYAQGMIDDIRQQFIAVVRQGRGARLKETPEMFSGMVWTGVKSVDLGLADGFGSVDSVARDIIRAEDVRDYTVKPNLAEKFARELGTVVANATLDALSGIGLQ